MKFSDADEVAMRHALGLLVEPFNDVPIAALVLDPQGSVIGSAVNERAGDTDPTAHAEIRALRAAGESRGHWRLDGCSLVVTLEPCPMCAGAAVSSRVERIVFGAFNPDYGACGSLLDIPRDPRMPHRPEVISGVLAAECGRLVSDFFVRQRMRGDD